MTKLNDKGELCIQVRVSDESKAHKLFISITKKLLISKDVVFLENEFWSWNSLTEKLKIEIIFTEEDNEMQQQKVDVIATEPTPP